MPSEVSTYDPERDPGPTVEVLKRELAEAREQQFATSAILHAISNAPSDAHSVFQKIAASAARLCDAYDAGVLQRAGDHLRLVAHHGAIPATGPIGQGTLPLTRGVLIGRAVLDRQTLHAADLQAETDEYPEGSELARRLGHRTILAVPLIRAGEAIGAIFIRRTEARPFTDRQIDLLKTFADQAVIVIENTRLFRAEQTRIKEVESKSAELRESLEYQTATGEVLSVISRSPNDVKPVLDTIARIAQRLCQAEHAFVLQREADGYRLVAANDALPDWVSAIKSTPLLPDRGSLTGRVALEKRTVHVDDLRADPEYTLVPTLQHGVRSELGVPLMRDGEVLGVIIVGRTEVRPFTDRQITLIETFADQAVIAIENTRLFEAEQASSRNLQESLEYQTAIGDVLNVISRSPNNLRPVFDIIAQSASRLCGGEYAIVTRYDGALVHLVAQHNPRPGTAEITANFYPLPADLTASPTSRAIATISVIHVPDVELEDFSPATLELYRRIAARAILAVPMVHLGRPIGTVSVSRASSGPFSDRQIELLKTFADQAVIAIENTRLFEEVQARNAELHAALEQQTETGEILNVISRSPTNVQPVFEAIAECSVRLCGANYGSVIRLEAGVRHRVADYGMTQRWSETANRIWPQELGRALIGDAAMLDRTIIHSEDIQNDGRFEVSQALARTMGYHTALAVPMLRESGSVGAIVVFRQEQRRFSEAEMGLLRTFADQAVIAIANARLFEEVQTRNRELRVALEQQTATSELLKVIGRSTFDLEPVFEELIESAVKLCGATRGFISRFDGKLLRFAAGYNVTPELREYFERHPFSVDRHSNTGRAALEGRTIHNIDVQTDPEYTYGGSKIDLYRTVLAIPMLKAGTLLGVILIYRHEVLPFTDNQIALIETFADQAVIAIENTRLFNEVQARNRDLTALREVGRAVSSTLELKVVLKTIVDRAVELSGTDVGAIFYFREEVGRFELGETTGIEEDVIARLRKLDIAAGQTGLGEAIANGKPLQVADVTKRASNPLRDAAMEAGLRAALIVPLLSADTPMGALLLQRRQPGEFPPAVVSLMQSFADQSAIALENARLFEEIAQKSRELEIASQHKSQFVANMSHELRTPLAAMLGYAELIQEGFYEPQGPKSLDALARIRANGKHLLGLINTLLDIAKIESGQFTLNMAEYAIESVVETVRSATESLAHNKKLALRTEVAKSLPLGLGDEQRLTQVLLNLVGNAIKFTDAGEVRVSATAANSHFTVTVADTGPGIPETHLARIFDQFHQVDSSSTKAKGGTGLGLAISKQIVEMHGGRIWVESTLGKGSTFQMELPIRAEFRKGVP